MENYRRSIGFKRRVLIVDDEMINREILGNILSETYEVSFAGDGEEAYAILQGEDANYSLILLDLLMPRMDGFELLKLCKVHPVIGRIPIIVMTSEKEAEAKSISLGADDFITKPYDIPEVILARCHRIIELYEDKQIISSAEKDKLTGLYSRELFFEYVRQIDILSKQEKMDAVVINVDHFHLVNEMLGRTKGDMVLKRIAQMIMHLSITISGIGCRCEADTFYLYCRNREDYTSVVSDIEEALGGLFETPRIRVRIGVYQDVDKDIDAETWFDRAKLSCDRIRGDYTHSIEFYNKELLDKSIYHERLINDIDDAIANGDFIVYYQPKYGIQSDVPELRSAEALIRWKHPELGMISPGDFIPLFEGNGLIQKLDNYVWKEAARQIRRWKERYGVVIPVSVNVSRIDIYDPELEDKLTDILKANDIRPEDMKLEITESAYSDDAHRLVEVVNNLRAHGFTIEMDDFGSGYSSLNMLTTIPIDVLKMDMKFIRNMEKDEKSLRMVELVMEIARFLNVPVVAEGVETRSQMETLRSMGCDLIQGYYFSKPVLPEEFSIFIEREHSVAE